MKMEDTKKKEYNKETLNKQQFSPVKLLSPKSTQGKNLTGSARHIRDLSADIHAIIQQWNAAHLQGLSILKCITQEKQDESYSQVLQEECDKLEVVCDELDDIVKQLHQITHQIRIMVSIEKSANKLFTTWPTTKFGDVAERIYTAYSREAEIKRKILEDVAHHHTDSWSMLFLATWVHQPFLPENLTTLLESLLVETGHR